MISVITVNYRTKHETERMIRSLMAHRPSEVEVLVVENGSGDQLQHLTEIDPCVQVIESGVNLGFAGGCQLAASRAKGDVLVLVNPDIVFTQDALTPLAQALHTDTSIGVAGISLKNMDGSQQSCVWRFPTPLDQFLLLLKIPHLFPNIGPIQRWTAKDMNYHHDQDVDQVMGACFGMRRAVWDELNGLDSGFFMWYEEVDFCRRARDAGYRIRFLSTISAQHEGGRSFISVGTWKKQAMVRRSIRRYAKKHWGREWWLLFCLCEPLFWVTAAGSALLRP